MSDDAFYIADGDRLIGTDFTRGPWSVDHQHGGPPSAAVARAIRRALGEGGWSLARVTFEFLRPVSLGPLTIAVREEAHTRSTRRFSAVLEVEGKPAILARALALRREALDLPAQVSDPPPRPPSECEPYTLEIFGDRPGYHRAFEIRHVAGTYGGGRMSVWMRPLVTLVAGEPLAPVDQLLVVADSCNGLSAAVDPRVITFISGDLTVHLGRPPRGPWTCVVAETSLDASGAGVAQGKIYDVEGAIAWAAQSLLVRARAAAR